jgi:hypothetical protein
MLGLEKKSGKRPIGITFRVGSKLFTPTFVRGLALAIGLHLSGFIIFQVSPFKIGLIETTFPPTQVNIDMGTPSDGAALAQLEGEGTLSKAMAKPKPSIPNIPPVTEFAMERGPAYPKEQTISRYPFQQIETGLYFTNFLDLSFPSPRSANRIEIQVCGDLANREILHTGWNDRDPLPSYSKGDYFAIYDIQVEDRTGRVFWYEQRQGPDKKKLNALAEKILHNLQFAKDPYGCVSLGSVEISLGGIE